jgi:glycosyltransferase A (GT-A) superfamily protein (DUF2064 family)
MNSLLLFAKYPEPGKVKTRLAQRIGLEAAANRYREMLEQVVRQTRPLNGEYSQVLYFDPPERAEEFSRWFTWIEEQRVQRGKSLGERMCQAIEESFRFVPPSLQRRGLRGGRNNVQANKILLIGTDCVEIDRQLICEAFYQLDKNDLVLGPATDGGYYFIGCRQSHPSLFEEITWSTDQVLKQTLEKAKELKLTIAFLPTLSDIDE